MFGRRGSARWGIADLVLPTPSNGEVTAQLRTDITRPKMQLDYTHHDQYEDDT